jgi:5-methylcytosine-specific restriction endonuclease McrA
MAAENITTKKCPDCNQDLLRTSFNKNAARYDGLQGVCQKCMRVRYVLKRESILAQHRERYVRDDQHRNSRKAYEKTRYGTHKAEHQARMRQYRIENAEHLRKAKREYSQRAEIQERRRLQYNARKVVAARCNAKKYNAQGDCTEQQWAAKLEYWGRRCYLCLSHLDPDKTEMEHRVPLCRGGSNWPANVAPACRPCNKSKAKRTEAEYRATH